MIFNYRPVNGQTLTEGFYSLTCPLAETIVRATMTAYYIIQPNIAPAMLKLHYSDCFVEGCDASVLLSGPNTERTADANLNLRGFEIIDDIKRQIELVCPGIVSCADILTLAARDAVVLTKGTSWEVKLGRKDGKVSLASNVKNLPSHSDSIDVLLKKFAGYGLNTEDFVALLGAHTIGSAACKYVTDRIYSINGSPIDSTINPLFLVKLQKLCPIDGDGSSRVALDTGSEYVFDTSIFKNILNGSAVLKIDQSLSLNQQTLDQLVYTLTQERSQHVLAFAWNTMSSIVKAGSNGEIRRICSKVN
ncbi:unnamed protein product [Microthlaspi erraticum]|uniref:Peroxidase n=1 Tax=Microthlaspi erraticum TaxID=1685480 RepID=A0A6D2IE25_9BRAS|nr:unnamed protein product [Microthlaspi erraticum]